MQVLYGRLQVAARKVCRDLAGPQASRHVERQACLRTALDGGVIAANSAALSALHLELTGRTPSAVAAK